MRAVFEKIDPEQSSSFTIRSIAVPVFDAPFHFHPEYELTWIISGEGQRYVGSQIDDFQAGDLVLLGENLPHCWLNQYTEGTTAQAIVLQFRGDCWGKDFGHLPEMKAIHTLLQQSSAGFQITGSTQSRITSLMQRMLQASATEKLLGLLHILHELSNSNELHSIDYSFPTQPSNQTDIIRFQKVFSFMIEHFKEDLSLEAVAHIAHLSPTSFCRYFKAITQKTFIEMLHEFRLHHVCQLLQKSDLPIQQIAFDAGFNDIPYFNKLFRKKYGITPNDYRKAMINKNLQIKKQG